MAIKQDLPLSRMTKTTKSVQYILLQTQNFLNKEFALKYGIWELLRHEKIPENHVLATLFTGNAWMVNGNKISCI